MRGRRVLGGRVCSWLLFPLAAPLTCRCGWEFGSDKSVVTFIGWLVSHINHLWRETAAGRLMPVEAGGAGVFHIPSLMGWTVKFKWSLLACA